MKLVIPLLILVLAAGLTQLQLFRINKIICQLDNFPCPLEYEPVLVPLSGQNIFRFNRYRLEDSLKQFDSRLTSIGIKKILPGTVRLELTRRRPLAKLEGPDRFWLMDTSGGIYQQEQGDYRNLPFVAVPDKFNPEQIFRLLAALTEQFVSFNQLIWVSETEAIIKTNLGPDAIIDPSQNLSAEAGSLQYILSGLKMEEQLPSKIDLRFAKPVLSY